MTLAEAARSCLGTLRTLCDTPPVRLRVLHFTEDGDTSGYFPSLVRHHDRSRFEMWFGTLRNITPELREVMDAGSVPVVCIGAGGRSTYAGATWRLHQALRRHRIDILHAHLFDPAIVGLSAAVAAGTPGRVLTRHHSDYHTRINKRWHVRLDRYCTALAQRVIPVSEETARVMRDEEHAPPGKLRVILNGVDFARITVPSADDIASLRRELDIPAGATVLGLVGRLHPEKGQEHFFRALPKLQASAGPLHVMLAGRGPAEEAYRRMVADMGLQNVRFLGFRPDVGRVMAASDIVVLPSVAEAFGLVLVEAMRVGAPVVATRVGGIPEIVQDGRSGLLVPPASPDALADAILRVLREPQLRATLIEGGRARAEDFRFERMMRAYEGVYDELGIGARA